MKLGLVAGTFDLLHHGYFLLFRDARTVCDYLIVALHVDPTIERPSKNKPIHSADEREFNLRTLRYVDSVVRYNTEAELEKLVSDLGIDVRIVGSDYQADQVTGKAKEIYFHPRTHDWSATRVRNLIVNSETKE